MDQLSNSAVPAPAPRRLQRVLITGSAGFIGSHLVRSYHAAGVAVRAVVNPGRVSPEPQRASPDGLEVVGVDLRDPAQFALAFDGQDLVVHAAAVTRAQGRDGRRLQERANVEMTQHVIDACRASGVPRLLHISSTAAIGISPDPRAPADERFGFNLDGLGLSYNVSKQQSERLALDANGAGLETVVVNPGVVFGRHGTRYYGGDVIARVLRSRVVVCTDGGLSMVHVDDVVDGIHRAAREGAAGQRYVLSGDNHSFRGIADIVCRVAGVRKTVLPVPDIVRDLAGLLSNSLARARDGGLDLTRTRRYAHQFYSSAKARRELGYAPRAFERIVADYLDATRKPRE